VAHILKNKTILFFILTLFVFDSLAQAQTDTLKKESLWSLGIITGSTSANKSNSNLRNPLGFNTGIIARINLKKNRFISTGILFNQYKYYLGYSMALPYGYPSNFYNSFYHIYSLPLYFNFQSQGQNSKFNFGIGAEALYWDEKTVLTSDNLRFKYFIGAKAGMTYRFKSNKKFSVIMEFTLKESNISAYYPGTFTFNSVGYNPYFILGFNCGLLYNFQVTNKRNKVIK
jgi:hypothetical protein